jgi:signal transduction histidine kinase
VVGVRAWVGGPAGETGGTGETAPGTALRLLIAVEDSGPGIPSEIRERIFEPFFTTKKEGTGLGLYICHEMIGRNGGEISAHTRAEGGAQFLLALPIANRPAAA